MRLKLNKKYTITTIPKDMPTTDNPLINDLWEGGYSVRVKSFLCIKYLLWTNLK